METHLLSQRLISLRGLIADQAESQLILREVDVIIALQKRQSSQEKDHQILSLKNECKSLREQVKKLSAEEKELTHTKENIESDLEIMTIKCENLQRKLKEINLNKAREVRKIEKQNKVVSKHCEIQVEILCPKMVEDLSRCYRKEREANESLRKEVRNYETSTKKHLISQSLEETFISESLTSEAQDASFQLEITPKVVQPTIEKFTEESEKYTVLDFLRAKSQQVLSFLSEQ